jgi:hypothetical protein
MKSLSGNFKRSLLTSLKTCFYCLFVFTLFYYSGSHLLIKLPISSAYLHSGGMHYLNNMVCLFLFLLADVNQEYNTSTRIFLVSSIIYLIYFPIHFLGILPPAIGMSGTCLFLLARFLFSHNRFSRILLFFIIINEMVDSFISIDSISHTVHLIGIFLGIFSLRYKKD